MSSGGAYGVKAKDTDFRKKWDKEEYAERAKKKDEEERERMQENEERLKQGRSILRMDCLPLMHCNYRKETAEGKEGGSPQTYRAHETERGSARS